jgi:2-dehydropantoate 2-reductase
MRISVFGTGAMGSLVGARLARLPDHQVALVGTWADALAAVQREGLFVEDDGGGWVSRPSAVALSGNLPAADLAIVLVKSYRTADVAPHVASCLSAEGAALTLQNGLGNAGILGDHVGSRRVLEGVTALGAHLLGPGRVRLAGAGPTVLAAANGSVTPQAVADLLGRAGIPATVDPAFPVAAWRKLAVNCAINPVSAILGVPNGRLMERADACLAMGLAAQEVADVAAAAGIQVGSHTVALVYEVAYATGENRSSMLQDVERRAQTEVDAINGAVVRLGRDLGVPTPVNEWLWSQVRSLEGVSARRRGSLEGCPGLEGTWRS